MDDLPGQDPSKRQVGSVCRDSLLNNQHGFMVEIFKTAGEECMQRQSFGQKIALKGICPADCNLMVIAS